MTSYLDPQRYGLFITVTTIAAWLGLADLGVATALTNVIARAEAHGDRAAQADGMTTAFVISFGIASVILTLGAVTLPLVPWQEFLSAPASVPESELHALLAAVAIPFALGIPLAVADRALAGLQALHVSNACGLLGNIFAIALAWSAVQLDLGIIPVASALSVAAPLSRGASMAYLIVTRPWLLPGRGRWDGALARELVGRGGEMSIGQLASIGMWQSSTVIVANRLGSAAVGPFATTLRLTTLYVGLLLVWFAPFWPAYADAAARGDREWIQRTYRRTAMVSLLSTAAAAIVLIAIGRPVIALWAGDAMVPPPELLLPLAILMCSTVACHLHAVVLNGLNRTRGLMVYYSIAALVLVPTAAFAADVVGASGVAWTVVAVTTPVALVAFAEFRVVSQRIGTRETRLGTGAA